MAKDLQSTCSPQAVEKIKENVEMNEGETIIACTRRHWVALVPQAGWPVLFVLIGILVFFYRARGGTLIAGWPVFDIVPELASVQRFDRTNLILLAVIVLGIVYAVYLYFEWIDDYLILTTERVITWNQVLLGKHSQSQIKIDDVQNVSATTKTYLQHWLNFGTITITSASFGTKLVFERAYAPREIQGKIMGIVGGLRKEQNKQNYDAIIQTRIYESKNVDKPPMPRPEIIQAPPLLNLIFGENPEVDEQTDTIHWRKHWVYIPIVLMKPVGFLLVGFFSILFVHQLGPISLLWTAGSAIVVLAIFLGWAAWEIEDERNESYILTPTNVIDVDKKPFGPEDRNTASLASIQNVTYKTTLISRMFGYGDVFIDTAGGGQRITFERLPNPANVTDIINQYQSIYRKGEKERSLNDAITLLKHYHVSEEYRHKIEEEERRIEEERDREKLLTQLLIPQNEGSGSPNNS
jgi:hypothetical protein